MVLRSDGNLRPAREVDDFSVAGVIAVWAGRAVDESEPASLDEAEPVSISISSS
jgi:hypothetical protein